MYSYNYKCAGIECVINKRNGKMYIGSSKNVANRIKGIEEVLKKNCSPHKKLQRAYNKEPHNFFFGVFKRVYKLETLREQEEELIEEYDCVNNGYNCLHFTDGIEGYEPTKVDLSKLKGRTVWNKGLTKETDSRVAVSAISLSKAIKGRPNWKKGLTKETDPRVAKQAEMQKSRGHTHVAWNKGLTKETDPRVAKSANTMLGKNKGRKAWNRSLTKETDPRIIPSAEALVTAQAGKDKFWANGAVAWNKGLTKETDLRVMNQSLSREKNKNLGGQ